MLRALCRWGLSLRLDYVVFLGLFRWRLLRLRWIGILRGF